MLRVVGLHFESRALRSARPNDRSDGFQVPPISEISSRTERNAHLMAGVRSCCSPRQTRSLLIPV
jgi:hypothetical protein